MEPLALTGNYRLAVAIIVGIVFGILLIKSDLAWRKTCLDALKLKDSRLIKTFLFSIFIGTALFYFARDVEMIRAHIRPAYFWSSLIGGILCGLGLTLCGKVPVSAISSLAAGRFYTIWVIIGMLLAYPAVSFVSGFLSDTLYNWSDPIPYNENISSYFSVENPALWISGAALVLLLFVQFTLGGDTDE
jgi:MFS family permease